MVGKITLCIALIISVFPTSITHGDESEQRVIVTLKDQVEITKEAELPDVIVESGVTNKIEELNVVTTELTASEITELENDPNVINIEEDKKIKVTSQQSSWGVEKVKSPRAWKSTFKGQGINIAVIDTGIDQSHSDLSIKGGVSFVGYTSSYTDDNGHGTHVAGIIAAKDNNIGVVGVAPEANIYAVKVLDRLGEGYLSDILKGIEWSIQNNMDIINISLGTDTASFALETAVNKAYAKGVAVVAAAGNEGDELGTGESLTYPAAYPNAISVAAVDSHNNRAVFSSTGQNVDYSAPGDVIDSTDIAGSYSSRSGTSMAAPFVSGIVALFKNAYPTLSIGEIVVKINQLSVDLGPTGKDPMYGYGLVQGPFQLIEVTEDKNIYKSKDSNVVIGKVIKGQTIFIDSIDTGWYKIQYGDTFGYINLENTIDVNPATTITGVSKNELTKGQFKAEENLTVYDNSTGKLIPFGVISKDAAYVYKDDVIDWYRVDFAGRRGFVYKPATVREFTTKDKYFQVLTGKVPIYDNSTGTLVQVGILNKNEVFYRTSDYGDWHQIKFGNKFGYIWKGSTSPISNPNSTFNELNDSTAKKFETVQTLPVYDNSSGKLIEFAQLGNGVQYLYKEDLGDWLKISIGARVGYVYKKGTSIPFQASDKYFEVTASNLSIYTSNNGVLSHVGYLEKGQSFPRISDYGDWHQIKFGNGVAYVWKKGTIPSNGRNISNINTGRSNTNQFFKSEDTLSVYTNENGKLVSYSKIFKSVRYPIISDIGDWYLIDVSGRLGYVYKPATSK